MKKLIALAVGIVLGLMLNSMAWAQLAGPPAQYRIGLSNEGLFLEADPQVPGRYTLYWSGWIAVDARSVDPIKLVGESTLEPLGQWTMSTTIRFGRNDLKPGINSIYQKFPVASIDLPEPIGGGTDLVPPASLFEYNQVVKIKLSIMRQSYWYGAPSLVERKYELRPLGLALLSAARSGDARLVRELLDKGTDVDSATIQNWTALMEAASQGHSEVVSILLDNGAEANDRTKGYPFVTTELGSRIPRGQTALMAACFSGNPRTVGLLLKAGAKVNYERSDRWTALMAAAYGGHTEIVRMLLAEGASVRVVSEWGYSPTALAAINGNSSIVRLLRSGGDVIRTPWDVLSQE